MEAGAAERSTPMSSALARCSATKASRSAAENGSLLRRAMSTQEATSPQCTHSSLVAAASAHSTLVHAWVEFGNRMFVALVEIVAVIVMVAAVSLAVLRSEIRFF